MKRRFLVPLLAIAGIGPASAEIVASPWLDFREAQIRLVAERSPAADGRLKAGLEIRLAPDYKTYWRNAGDSGVPPQFDFATSQGIVDPVVAFPFPTRFDDGAGGQAWGYKHAVILPIAAGRGGGDFSLHLKIDFAVCGTMCIPLNGALALESRAAAPVPAAEGAALDAAIATLPLPAPETPAPQIRRIASSDTPRWQVRLPYAGDAASFAAFPEGRGFLDVEKIEQAGAGHIALTIAGHAEPGSGGKFGPVRLTYGEAARSFECVIDLDGAP